MTDMFSGPLISKFNIYKMAFDADIGSESISPHHHLPFPERYKRIIFLFVYFIACMLNLNKEL